MARREELTDEQWAIIASLIPEPPRREDGRGRPWKDSREVMNGILWVLRSGARWEDLPERFPPYQTCHRRFQQWIREGVLRSVLEALAEDLRARGELDLSECFIDGMFVAAKKGGSELERPTGAGLSRSLPVQFCGIRPGNAQEQCSRSVDTSGLWGTHIPAQSNSFY
jgi:transposase